MIDMTNADTTPVTSTATSVVVMATPASTNFAAFTAPQPSITGMARKNVNSAAAVREQPVSMPPMIVAPERLVPGMIASTWKRPILSAVFQSMSSTSVILNSCSSARASSCSRVACAWASTRACLPRGRGPESASPARASWKRRWLRRSSTMKMMPYRMSIAATQTLL